MANGERNGWVSYKIFIPTIMAVSVTAVAASWTMLSSHATRPHDSAVSIREFEVMKDDIAEIRNDVREIRRMMYDREREP